MIIRPASVEDSEALAHIQVDSYRNSYAKFVPQDYLAGFSYEEQTQNWQELLSAEIPPILFVTEDENGEVVGYALSRAESSITPYEVELVSLHVRKANQQQGVGRQLVNAIAKHFAEQDCSGLMLWVLSENHPARAFYERLGGQLIGKQTISISETVTVEEVAYGWPSIDSLIV